MEALKPTHDKLIGEALAVGVADLIHVAEISREPAERPLAAAAKVLAEVTLKSGWRGLNCRIGVAKGPATGIDHLLVLGSQEYIDVVAGLDGVEEYEYWNNSDGPDHVTAEEWAERRDAWDRIFPGLGNVRENMTVWSLDNGAWRVYSAFRADRFSSVEPHLPLEDRATNHVRDRIFCAVEDQGSPDINNGAGDIFGRLRRANKLATRYATAPARKLIETTARAHDI
ncbi:hypothetical protein ACX80Z_15390 [Arthrobacter sp. TMT4-20]